MGAVNSRGQPKMLKHLFSFQTPSPFSSHDLLITLALPRPQVKAHLPDTLFA